MNLKRVLFILNKHLLSSYIELDQVEVQYTTFVHGLRKVSLKIEKGEFVFFVGQTGAGKSTLLKLFTREVWHDRGIVRLAGSDLGSFSRSHIPRLRQSMGIVPQDFALLPKKTVWENVAYAMRAAGHTKREVLLKVPGILESVAIGHRADAYPTELSGGEQQRVAIGRALVNNPPLILADEPTGNLDPGHSWEIMEVLAKLNATGVTVLVASHDITVVERMGRRVVTMLDGQIISDTNPCGTSSKVDLEKSEALPFAVSCIDDAIPSRNFVRGEDVEAPDYDPIGEIPMTTPEPIDV